MCSLTLHAMEQTQLKDTVELTDWQPHSLQERISILNQPRAYIPKGTGAFLAVHVPSSQELMSSLKRVSHLTVDLGSKSSPEQIIKTALASVLPTCVGSSCCDKALSSFTHYIQKQQHKYVKIVYNQQYNTADITLLRDGLKLIFSQNNLFGPYKNQHPRYCESETRYVMSPSKLVTLQGDTLFIMHCDNDAQEYTTREIPLLAGSPNELVLDFVQHPTIAHDFFLVTRITNKNFPDEKVYRMSIHENNEIAYSVIAEKKNRSWSESITLLSPHDSEGTSIITSHPIYYCRDIQAFKRAETEPNVLLSLNKCAQLLATLNKLIDAQARADGIKDEIGLKKFRSNHPWSKNFLLHCIAWELMSRKKDQQ